MGESVTGLTTIRLDAGLDTGDMLLRRELPIGPEDTAETLAPVLAQMGAPLMVETLRGLEAGTVRPVPQDHSQASLAPILKKEDGLIDFKRTAGEIWNRLRGFQPWPGACTAFRGKTLNLWQARPLPSSSDGLQPGQIKVDDHHLCAGCGQSTSLELLEVQVEGKKRMTARDFINGYRPQPGESFGG
jgi:methionyl-tRNA formyltransferase